VLIGVGIAGFFVLAVAGAAVGYLWYENQRIHRIAVAHLVPIPRQGVHKDAENILLIGSTTRCGLKQQSTAFGLCDEGVTGVNSDVIMILHLDPDHNRASLLSIPRDTFVPNAHHDGVNKIDAALAAGPSQLIAAVEQDFGIPIQHFVELNFDSFQGVVTALGGLHMYFPMPVYDSFSTLNIQHTGCIDLNGFTALALVRARHLQYKPPGLNTSDVAQWPSDPQSDPSRIRRDHEFLRVLASAVAQRGLGNPVTDLELVNAVAGDLTVDSGFSAHEMADLVLEFHSINPYRVPAYTLPVVIDGNPNGYTYRGSGYGDVVFPVQPQDGQVVARFLGTDGSTDPTGHALPARPSVTVAVENGTGAYDQGAATATALGKLGYRVTSVGDTQTSATTSEATVLYSRPEDLGAALRVQADLSGLAVVGYDPGLWSGNGTIDVGSTPASGPPADVVLVTGSNFSVNPPPAPATTTTTTPTTTAPTTTTTTAPSSGSTTTTTTIPAVLATNPDLGAPIPSQPTLEPWDPRSCTASGGEGP
jgi:LCP family protein required for cell wall assembly